MLPISPLFASIITRKPLECAYLHKDDNKIIPSGPNCSNNAICGFTAGTFPITASSKEKQNVSTILILLIVSFSLNISGIKSR